MKVIAPYFKSIYIFPDQKHKRLRQVPTNVQVIWKEGGRTSWFNVLLTVFARRLILIEFLRNLFANPARNKVLLMNLQWAISKKSILAESIDFKKEGYIFYSYWMNHSAVALSLIDERIERVARVHNWDVYEERQKYSYLPLRKFLIEKLDTIYPISRNAATYLSEKYGQGRKVKVSRLGVFGINLNDDRSDAGFDQMISVSNMVALKRVDLIARAFQKFEERLNWTHFGGGELLNEMKATFGDEYFMGQVPNEDVLSQLNELKHSAFLINLSQYEGIPVSMMEAMSYGIPCIGTNVGGVGEIIENGVNGFLLSANPGEQEVVVAIGKLLSMDSEAAKTMRQNASSTWESKFNAETNFREFSEKLTPLG